MALVRISNNKWIDPSLIVAVAKAENNRGYSVCMDSGDKLFVTNDEWNSISSYVPIGVKCTIVDYKAVSGTSPIAIDSYMNANSVFLLNHGNSTYTYTINVSSLNNTHAYQFIPWKDVPLTITNDTSSSVSIRTNGNVSSLASQATYSTTTGVSPFFIVKEGASVFISK